jgi:signal transduction histidine kinase
MPPRTSLRQRIVGAYVLLALALGLVFSAIAFVSVEAIEDRLIDQRLQDAADTLIRDHLKGELHRIPGFPVVLQGDDLPPALASLPPGLHELELDGRELHVVIDHRDGQRFAVMDDESQFDRIERYVFVVLAGAIALCGTVAALLGLSTASRVIAPVTQLAEAVDQGNLGHDSPLLHARDELGMLARAFFAHTEQLKGFLEREQLFTGDVSHELRTPLMIMLGGAELLHARLPGQPDLQEVAERIRRTAADTAERVTALLLLSRSPAWLDVSSIDLIPVLANEVERCRPLLRGKSVHLWIEAGVPHLLVAARPELAAIALGNLIRNACQFTERGEVRVQVTADSVVVHDTGSGVPESIRGHIFNRHVRGDPSSGEGSGLGLAIVRRVAEHLHWRVSLDCPAAGGCRFEVNVRPGREATIAAASTRKVTSTEPAFAEAARRA